MCKCDLCEAREKGINPMESLFPEGSKQRRLIRAFPGKPVYWYDEIARIEQNFGVVLVNENRFQKAK